MCHGQVHCRKERLQGDGCPLSSWVGALHPSFTRQTSVVGFAPKSCHWPVATFRTFGKLMPKRQEPTQSRHSEWQQETLKLAEGSYSALEQAKRRSGRPALTCQSLPVAVRELRLVLTDRAPTKSGTGRKRQARQLIVWASVGCCLGVRNQALDRRAGASSQEPGGEEAGSSR